MRSSGCSLAAFRGWS